MVVNNRAASSFQRVSVDVGRQWTIRRQFCALGRRCHGERVIFVVVVSRKTQTSLTATVTRRRAFVTDAQGGPKTGALSFNAVS